MTKLYIKDLEHLVEVQPHQLVDVKGGVSPIPIPRVAVTNEVPYFSAPQAIRSLIGENGKEKFVFALPEPMP